MPLEAKNVDWPQHKNGRQSYSFELSKRFLHIIFGKARVLKLGAV